MTSLSDWIQVVEFYAPSEAKELYNTIHTLQSNDRFSIETKTEDHKTIQVITKIGFRQILEIKSDIAKTKILKDISDNYLPLNKLR